MSFNECQDLVEKYGEWLKQKFTVQDIGGICEIVTPFVDRHNDFLQIYVKRSDNSLILTDDGYTISDLKLSGFEITTDKRKRMLNAILNGFGVRLDGDQITIKASVDNYPQKKHNLIQAMLAINDMFVMAKPVVASLFKEDVENYLHLNQIRYTPAVKFAGKSGFDQSFDFVIPASQKQPERIINTINHPNRQNISFLIFMWADTKDVRPVKSTTYGFLNDSENKVNPEFESALQQYGIKPLLWSKRDKYVTELVQ